MQEQMFATTYLNQEAKKFLKEASENDGLEAILQKVTDDINGISTLNFNFDSNEWNSQQVIWYLDNLIGSDSQLKGYEDLIYGLYSLSLSEIRYEALNNQEFSLDKVQELIDDRLSLFGQNPTREHESLLKSAIRVKEARENLPEDTMRYEFIDGSTRVRSEKILKRRPPLESEECLVSIVNAIKGAKTKEDYIAVITELSYALMEKTGADYVLFSGPVRELSGCQDTTIDDFFSYIYVRSDLDLNEKTSCNNLNGNSLGKKMVKEGIENFIGQVFRGARKRYFDKGYHTLLPGLAVNEYNRWQHKWIGLRSMIRTPGDVSGKEDVVDLRCASTRNFNFTDNDLNKLVNLVQLYSKVLESAFSKGIELPCSYKPGK